MQPSKLIQQYENRQILKPSKYQSQVNYTMTPAAIRARQPYFWKNVALASGLFIFVGSIYAYSLKALVQDDFADVPIPPISEDKLRELRKEREESKN